jgi:hypothetical protein
MRHGLIAGIAAVAIALALGALFANWEKGFGPDTAAMPNAPMRDGRDAGDQSLKRFNRFAVEAKAAPH